MFMGVGRVGRQMLAGAAFGAGGQSPSLDISLLSALDSRITFTRASSASYFDVAGVLQTAGTNVPRFDYHPTTHVAQGLLIEEARTNLCLQSANVATAPWATSSTGGPVVPTLTANNAVAPDGTTTAARIVQPAVSIASSMSQFYQQVIAAGGQYQTSFYLRGNVGGEQTYIYVTPDGVTVWARLRVTLTTAWQRFTVDRTWGGSEFVCVGTDLRDVSQTSTPAQTIYAWGGQVELGAFATSYIPTGAAGATRAQDVATTPASAAWFNPNNWSWAVEAQFSGQAVPPNPRMVGETTTQAGPLYVSNTLRISCYDTSSALTTANAITLGTVFKCASSYGALVGSVCLNGGAVVSGAQIAKAATAVGYKFGGDAVAGEQFNGYLRRIRFWPRTLSSAELIAASV